MGLSPKTRPGNSQTSSVILTTAPSAVRRHTQGSYTHVHTGIHMQIHHPHMNTPHTRTQAHVHTCKAHTATRPSSLTERVAPVSCQPAPAGSCRLPGEASGIKTS